VHRDSEEDFQRNLKLGRRWELAVAAWLKSRGWLMMPDYASLNTGGAPKLAGASGGTVLPDLLGADRGCMKYVEVKYRTKVVVFRRRRQKVTGKIKERLWEQYLRVEDQTGIPVWLVFIQKVAAEVVGAPIRHIARHCHHGVGEGSGYINIDYECLDRLASIDEISKFDVGLRTAASSLFSREDMAAKVVRLIGPDDDDERIGKWVHCMSRGAASDDDVRAVVAIARQSSEFHGPRCVCAVCFERKLKGTRQ
jgi:Holliday junction resolvase-like predicted endonuclease